MPLSLEQLRKKLSADTIFNFKVIEAEGKKYYSVKYLKDGNFEFATVNKNGKWVKYKDLKIRRPKKISPRLRKRLAKMRADDLIGVQLSFNDLDDPEPRPLTIGKMDGEVFDLTVDGEQIIEADSAKHRIKRKKRREKFFAKRKGKKKKHLKKYLKRLTNR